MTKLKIKGNGGYSKHRKNVSITSKTILADLDQYYGQVFKVEGSHRVTLEIYNDDGESLYKVVGLVVGKIRKMGIRKEDIVLCVPNYSGTNGDEYGVIHKYREIDYKNLMSDSRFRFTVKTKIEEEPEEYEDNLKPTRDNILDDIDSDEEYEDKPTVFVPSLDDL